LRAAGSATPERILIATAAALLGLLAVLLIVPPVLSDLGREANWLWAVYVIPLFILPLALLIPAVIRPRSVAAAVVAALPVGLLLMLGLNAEPMSLPRFAIHLAAILCLAALVLQVIRGIVDRRFRVLWIALALLLGLVIGYLAAATLGLHIRSQFCNWPPLGAGISSYLCSG
jgi:hypothetical protein